MLDIQKITKKAGVSIVTVSHVINKARYISPELTVKVEKVIKDLNCKSNIIAGNLYTRRQKPLV